MEKGKFGLEGVFDRVNEVFTWIGDLDTAYQLVAMYMVLLGFETVMPNLALVIGSWFGYIGYIGHVSDVAENSLKRSLGKEVTIEAEDYRKEMVVVMGLTFIEFWTMWTGALTGEGVVLLVGYIAIQMLIVMMSMVLKDQIARVLGSQSILEFLIEKCYFGFKTVVVLLIEPLDKLTSQETNNKVKKKLKYVNEPKKYIKFFVDAFKSLKNISVNSVSIIPAQFSIFGMILKGVGHLTKLIDKINTAYENRSDEKFSFKTFLSKMFQKLRIENLRKVVSAFVVSKWLSALLYFINFMQMAKGVPLSWEVVFLGLFYIAAFLFIDFFKALPIIIIMWLSIRIVLWKPIRQVINKWDRKVQEWRNERNNSENMAV